MCALTIMNGFVVISDGTGWACVSEYGEDIMKQCANTTWPENATDTSNIDICGLDDNSFSSDFNDFNDMILKICICYMSFPTVTLTVKVQFNRGLSANYITEIAIIIL